MDELLEDFGVAPDGCFEVDLSLSETESFFLNDLLSSVGRFVRHPHLLH